MDPTRKIRSAAVDSAKTVSSLGVYWNKFVPSVVVEGYCRSRVSRRCNT